MKWYWKCMLSVAAVLCIFAGSVRCIFAESTVTDTFNNSAVSVVDPMNAVIATGVMLGIGVFAYIKRHSHRRQIKKKMD